jgi:ATP-binding cassette subfamily F protein uup
MTVTRTPEAPKRQATTAAAAPVAPNQKKKQALSHKEANELAALPEKIDAGERERTALYASLADPAFLRNGPKVSDAKARLTMLEKELEGMVLRWEALEARN